MKNIIIFFALTLSLFFTSSFSYANDCPFGLVNDPAPGQCGRFVDSDKSGFCDHSEPLAQNITQYEANTQPPVEDPNELITGQDLKTKTVTEVAQIYNININQFIKALQKEFSISQISTNTSFQLLHDNYGVQPSVVKQIASNLTQGVTETQPQQPATPKQVAKTDRYNFGLISSITLIAYAISWFLSYKKIYSVITHRMIWNSLLGFHFFGTSLL